MSYRQVRSLLLVGAIAFASCGGSSAERSTADTSSRAASSPLPAITVQDVTADRSVALDSFIPSDKPTLLWFWAPH
jgi:hypothetical protein